jgi:hypothetical protein
MGWGVELVRDGEVVAVPRHCEGSNVALGGLAEASMTVTYNYGGYFECVFGSGGLRRLDGRRAGDTVELLRDAVDRLGTARDDNYWKSTQGNAGWILSVMLRWAQQHPDATWRVD